MRQLDRYLTNPFDDGAISIAELLAFSTDHLQRMIAKNNGGALTARIAATTPALHTLEDGVSDDQSQLGLRKSRKLAKDNFRATLPAAVAKISAAVVARFGEGAPEVFECLPQGRSVFGDCRDDQMTGHLQALLTGLTTHQAELGAAVVTDATNLKAAWVALYNASESSTGNKTTTEDEKNAARQALQAELFLNLLAIAALFPRQPEKLALYMTQSLLENPSAPAATPPAPAPGA